MNLAEINGIFVIPGLSYGIWGTGAAFLVLWAFSRKEVPSEVGFFVASVAILGIIFAGKYVMHEAIDAAQNTALHQGIKSAYELDATVGYKQLKDASEHGKTVVMESGKDRIEVRPLVSGDTLTLIRVSDSTVLTPANRAEG